MEGEIMKLIPTKIMVILESYRLELLESGMLEPKKFNSSAEYWRFYKPMTELTAFIVNLRVYNNKIKIVYGFSSTASVKMGGDEKILTEYGVSDEEITVRQSVWIHSPKDELKARIFIIDMYDRYRFVEKDELLRIKKEKQKEFIGTIAKRLKPLGFKKKNTTWIKMLSEEYYLMFQAQKSNFSDEYYFNIDIGKLGSDGYGDCYYTRTAPNEMFPMDWQIISGEVWSHFLEKMVQGELLPLINTPLIELGKLPYIWSGCYCDRKRCNFCWVEHNFWETKSMIVNKEEIRD